MSEHWGTKLRHVIFIIIELQSDMALFSTGIQLVRLVTTSVLAVQIPTDIIIACNLLLVSTKRLTDYKTRSFQLFVLLPVITFTWRGRSANNKFCAGVNEFVLR